MRFEPPVSETSAAFWRATRDRRFVLPWCPVCSRSHWFPREVCPFCLAPALEWRESLGNGEVYACSVMPKPGLPQMADLVPYVVALISLDEGVRMMSNVLAEDPYAVAVGDRVRLDWEPLSDGRHLPVFRPS
ncbi:MAG: OB-fold domain-containing protein [Acidimicrobiales bacterium]|nr:OB-fold domain-containing protein [Acidimicrobiales bacterium]